VTFYSSEVLLYRWSRNTVWKLAISFRVADSVIFSAHFLYAQHVVFCIVTPPSLALAGHPYFTPEHDLNYTSSRMYHNAEAQR